MVIRTFFGYFGDEVEVEKKGKERKAHASQREWAWQRNINNSGNQVSGGCHEDDAYSLQCSVGN